MSTLLTVLDVKYQAEKDYIIFPRGLAENTWFRYLPMELAHVLMIVSVGAAKEKDELRSSKIWNMAYQITINRSLILTEPSLKMM